jgi:hypothetical protein
MTKRRFAILTALACAPLALQPTCAVDLRDDSVSQDLNTWTSIGGSIIGAPDACSWGAGRLDVFARGLNLHVWHQWFDNAAWTGWWEDMGTPPPGALSDPTCVSWGAGRIDLFVVGADGNLWTRSIDGAPWQWTGWISRGAPAGVKLVAVESASAIAQELDIVATGTDAGNNLDVYHLAWHVNAWTAWDKLWRLANVATPYLGAPAVASDLTLPYARFDKDHPENDVPHLSVFAINAWSHLATTETMYFGSTYDGWRDLAYHAQAGADAAAFPDGSVHTAVRADDNSIAVRLKTSTCGRWFSAGGAATSDPSIVAFTPGIDGGPQDAIFVRDRNGSVSYTVMAPPAPTTTDCDVRPILSFTSVPNVAQLNTSAFGGAPPRPTTACDPSGQNREFMLELLDELPAGSAAVLEEWAPRTPAPDPNRPTVTANEVYIEGDVALHGLAGGDYRFDHPFGNGFFEPDQSQAWPDDEIDIRLDPTFLQFQNPVPEPLSTANNDGPGLVHVELAKGQIAPPLRISSLPGYLYKSPGTNSDGAGYRAIAKGQWIHDCGHTPYPSELHPPSFMAYASAVSATATHSIAFANPYRMSQLYNPDHKELATDFNNQARYTADGTRYFADLALSSGKAIIAEEAFKSHDCASAIAECVILGPFCATDPGFWAQVLACQAWEAVPIIPPDVAGGLVEATHIDQVLSWQVCAPQPRPAGMVLGYTYHFTTRTGIQVFPSSVDNANGCVSFMATESNDYVPMPVNRSDFTWTVQQILADKNVEEPEGFDTLLTMFGADTNLTIDSYPPLTTGNHAVTDAPLGVDQSADDQPYPFFGAATVAWQPASPCASGVSTEPFTQGMVGCPGSVAWGPNGSTAMTLCNAGVAHLCTSSEWHAKRGTFGFDGVIYDNYPTHDYWTADNLGYTGTGTNSCSASLGGYSCGTNRPMRVCAVNGLYAPTNPDPEGNTCTWADCGLGGANAPDEYMGGCVANPTAGALCCLN